MKKELAAVNARFKELTPWLTDEERNKVYVKYVLYIVRYFPSKGTRVFVHDKTEFTSAEYCEFKKQVFPDGIIKHFDYFDRWLGHEALIQLIKDYSAAHLDGIKEERKSPLKRIIQHFSEFKDLDPDKIEEGDIFKTTDGSVFKAIETPDYTVKTVLAKCLQSNNVWHVFGDKLYICIENVTKLLPRTPKGFPVGSYVTPIKECEGGVYRITEPMDELGCQMATRIVPRNYSKRNIKYTAVETYVDPDTFRAITPEEMNEKLIKFLKYLSNE